MYDFIDFLQRKINSSFNCNKGIHFIVVRVKLLNISSTTRPLQRCNGLVVELTFSKKCGPEGSSTTVGQASAYFSSIRWLIPQCMLPSLPNWLRLLIAIIRAGKYYVHKFYLMWFILELVLGLQPRTTHLLNALGHYDFVMAKW
jgi:hypothetical protein